MSALGHKRTFNQSDQGRGPRERRAPGRLAQRTREDVAALDRMALCQWRHRAHCEMSNVARGLVRLTSLKAL